MHYIRIFISYVGAFLYVLVTSILQIILFPVAVLLFLLGALGLLCLICMYVGAGAAIFIISIGIVFLCELYNQFKKDEKKYKKDVDTV